jgi:CDGSH iron-sulfur domain-containing protein 3
LSEEVRILVRDNGPYRVYGPAKLVDVEGNEYEVPAGEWYTLCRCGLSNRKPFCDSTHKHSGFADESVARPLPKKE